MKFKSNWAINPRYHALADFLINVILPVTIACSIYYFSSSEKLSGFIRNQLPDGLWAYSLTSCILIIWNRRVNTVWITAILMLFIIFEWLQYKHIVKGTGDIYDLIVYAVFSCFTLAINHYIKTSINITNKPASKSKYETN